MSGQVAERATWSTAYVNDLPDSAFACIDAGGEKDGEGKTAPRSLRHYPHHDAEGKVDPAHLANARARVNQAGTASCGYDHLFKTHRLPSDRESADTGLVRSLPGYIELRVGDKSPDFDGELEGHFAVFNQWTHIRSVFEGEFMETIEPGAFADTIADDRPRMKVLYDHGLDPTFGNKPLGPIADLREDETGAYYRVPLIRTSYNNDLKPMARAGLLGSSFRFQVNREDFDPRPKRSDHNPDGLPERRIRAAQVPEFGPVTFPAYAGATAGMRSDTDAYLARLQVPLRDLTSARPDVVQRPVRSGERRTTPRFASREEYLQWLLSI
jgi:HK97 family phage prohead protease